MSIPSDRCPTCMKTGPVTFSDVQHALEHMQAEGTVRQTVGSDGWGAPSIAFELTLSTRGQGQGTRP